MTQYYLGKDGYKLKIFHHAYGYYKNTVSKSNIYKSNKSNTIIGENAHLCVYSIVYPNPEYLWIILIEFWEKSPQTNQIFLLHLHSIS